MNGKAEPRFDIDLKYGVEAEVHVAQLLDWIVGDNGLVEVKRKRILDLWFYVETHCDKGRRGTYQPSGISVTTASTWFFALGDSGITVSFPTDLLRSMLDDASVRDKEELDGSCPTRGKLINLAVLLYRYKQRRETERVVTAAEPLPALPPTKKPKLMGRDQQGRPIEILTADDINWGWS